MKVDNNNSEEENEALKYGTMKTKFEIIEDLEDKIKSILKSKDELDSFTGDHLDMKPLSDKKIKIVVCLQTVQKQIYDLADEILELIKPKDQIYRDLIPDMIIGDKIWDSINDLGKVFLKKEENEIFERVKDSFVDIQIQCYDNFEVNELAQLSTSCCEILSSFNNLIRKKEENKINKSKKPKNYFK